jgi:hypothetical protein
MMSIHGLPLKERDAFPNPIPATHPSRHRNLFRDKFKERGFLAEIQPTTTKTTNVLIKQIRGPTTGSPHQPKSSND